MGALVLLVGTIAFAVLHQRSGSSPEPKADSTNANPDAAPAPVASQDTTPPTPPPENPPPARSVSAPAKAVARSITVQPLPPASAASQQLIQRLLQVGSSVTNMTPEQVAEFKENVQQLIAQGAAAVPAIRRFLEQSQDLKFEDPNHPSPVGYGSLRLGLLDALRQIGGQDSIDALAGVLHGTTEPAEIGSIARGLDQLAPGQYRQEALTVARATLEQAAGLPSPNRDVGPLFQVMQTYGDVNVVPDLVKALPDFHIYASMALAGLPDGQGLASLIERVQDPAQIARPQNAFALQMLAQVSAQFPDAAAALIEQARQNQAPDWVWTRVADALGGDQYLISKPDSSQAVLGFIPGLKTYHISSGDQTYYSLPYDPARSPDQTAQRRAIIDQLLANLQNPAGVQALQNARAALNLPGQ